MNQSSDIVIHVNEELDSQHIVTLSDKVQKITGVESAFFKKRRPHLMIVAYNSTKTKAQNVLQGVRDTGMHAQLVGWL